MTAFRPQLCKSVDFVPTGRGYAMEPKLDGWRCLAVRDLDGVRIYGGRNAADYTGQALALEAELTRILSPGTVIDGELVSPHGWGFVQSAMTRGGGFTHTEVQLVAFDLLQVGGVDARGNTWEQRRECLESALQDADPEIVSTTPVLEASQEQADALVAEGWEGVVVKQRNSRYSGGRSNAWVKYKPQTSDEAVVVGIKDSDANPGTAGGFYCELLSDRSVRFSVKCGTDARHREATVSPELWIGAVIEVKHHGLDATSGVPRHPMFFRRRDDRAVVEEAPVPAPAPAATKKATKRPPADRSGKHSGRNYGAMGAAKLAACIEELRAGSGDAYQRCVSKGADPAKDLAVAVAVSESRGVPA